MIQISEPTILYSAAEAASFLNCHLMTLNSLERDGLKAETIGLRTKIYTLQSLKQFQAYRAGKQRVGGAQ